MARRIHHAVIINAGVKEEIDRHPTATRRNRNLSMRD
jgi:hypothetical protein